MRVEFKTGKEDGRRQFGVKLLGAVISVALLVAVAMAVGGSGNSASARVGTKGLYVGSGKIDMDAIEREVFESTGLRVKVVQAHELAALGRKKMKKMKNKMVKGDDSLVSGDTTYGTFALKYTLSNRYLSSHNGEGNKLSTENSASGDDDKWQFTVDGSGGGYKVQSKSDTSQCAAIETDSDVRLWNNCSDNKTKLVLLRLDTNTSPGSNYDSSWYLLYGYLSGQRFIKVSSSGSVSSGQNPGDEGIFEFVSA